MAWTNSWAAGLILVVVLQYMAVQGSKQGPTVQGSKRGPIFLQLYAHESREPPSNTLIVSAAPSGSKTGADEFGLIRTVSNVLREGRSAESRIIGSQVGMIVVGKDNADVYISFTYFLNENAAQQGTIAVHGHIDGTSLGERTFAVVGGTGAFLSVTGYDHTAYDPPLAPNPASILNVHNLTLHHYPHCDW